MRGVYAVRAGPTEDALKQALAEAYEHDGLSLVHVPVFWGDADRNSLGAYGRWNVGPWVTEVEALYKTQVI